jgi:hypothetical protein
MYGVRKVGENQTREGTAYGEKRGVRVWPFWIGACKERNVPGCVDGLLYVLLVLTGRF